MQLFATKEILSEIREKMRDKLKISLDDAELFIEDILTYTKLIKIKEMVRVVEKDADDDKFIDCAIACNADFIVSGDSHLLEIKEYRGIRIFRVREFLEEEGLL